MRGNLPKLGTVQVLTKRPLNERIFVLVAGPSKAISGNLYERRGWGGEFPGLCLKPPLQAVKESVRGNVHCERTAVLDSAWAVCLPNMHAEMSPPSGS